MCEVEIKLDGIKLGISPKKITLNRDDVYISYTQGEAIEPFLLEMQRRFKNTARNINRTGKHQVLEISLQPMLKLELIFSNYTHELVNISILDLFLKINVGLNLTHNLVDIVDVFDGLVTEQHEHPNATTAIKHFVELIYQSISNMCMDQLVFD